MANNADALLEGEPFDPDKPADQAIREAVEKELADSVNRPLMILFNTITRLLDVPTDDESFPADDTEELDNRANAARDLSMAIHYHQSALEQPTCHETIYEIIKRYELSLAPDAIAHILTWADVYASE
jgi:hypothetical protein